MGQAKPEWKSSALSTRAGPSEDSTHDSHVQLAELLNLSVYSQRRRHTKPPPAQTRFASRAQLIALLLTRLRRYRSQTSNPTSDWLWPLVFARCRRVWRLTRQCGHASCYSSRAPTASISALDGSTCSASSADDGSSNGKSRRRCCATRTARSCSSS